jgi:hypothetical protein
MEEWFYVKNDLKTREDIKEIIMRPIWSRFGLRRPKVEIDDVVEACQKAFSIVCSFIGTRDLSGTIIRGTPMNPNLSW